MLFFQNYDAIATFGLPELALAYELSGGERAYNDFLSLWHLVPEHSVSEVSRYAADRRQCVIDMHRELGLPCYCTSWANFNRSWLMVSKKDGQTV